MVSLIRDLIPLVNDNHVDNNLKEILVYVYFGSTVFGLTVDSKTCTMMLLLIIGVYQEFDCGYKILEYALTRNDSLIYKQSLILSYQYVSHNWRLHQISFSSCFNPMYNEYLVLKFNWFIYIRTSKRKATLLNINTFFFQLLRQLCI